VARVVPVRRAQPRVARPARQRVGRLVPDERRQAPRHRCRAPTHACKRVPRVAPPVVGHQPAAHRLDLPTQL